MNDQSRPLRILLWAPMGAGDHYFGPGISAWRLYSYGARTGVEVDLAHSYPDHAAYGIYRRQFCVDDLGRPGVTPRWSHVWRATRWLRQHAARYDVIHALGEHWYTVLPIVLARPATAPVVVKMTGGVGGALAPRTWRHRLFWAVTGVSRLKHRIDAVIVLNSGAMAHVLAAGFASTQVVPLPNGVDTDAYQPATAEQRGAARAALGWSDRLTFIVTGGLAPRKNQALLCRVVVDLQRRGIDCQLVVVGPERADGYLSEVQSAAAEARAGTVHILGHRADLRQLYQASDVFVLPSTAEGMSNSLLEAMASGLPVIVGDNPGNRELVSDGVEGLVVACAHSDLVLAATAMAESRDLRERCGRSGRLRVENRHSYAAVWAAHISLFNAVRQSRAGQVGTSR